jgi:hypothetical protein
MFDLFKKKPQRTFSTESKPGAASQIVPRIKHIDFLVAVKPVLAQLAAAGGDPITRAPITRPLVGDLIVSYSFDTPTQFISVTHQDMHDLGLNADSLHEVAVNNLLNFVGSSVTVQDLHLYQAIAMGGDLEASSLLIPALWNSLSMKFSGELLAVVPSRNTVLFMDSRHQVQAGGNTLSAMQVLDLMCAVALDTRKDSTNHGLSENVLAWRNSSWQACGTLSSHSSSLSA